MLKQPLPGRARKRVGFLVLGLVLASGSYAAWAVQPAASDRAPAILDSFVPGLVVAVDIPGMPQIASGEVQITGGAMRTLPQGGNRVFLGDNGPMEITIGTGDQMLHFAARATAHTDGPDVDWVVTRNGVKPATGRLRLEPGQQRVLAIGGPGQGVATTVELTFRAQVDPAAGGDQADAHPLHREGNGDFTDPEVGGIYAETFTKAGTADLLLHVSPRGIVERYEIERVDPAGGFTEDNAHDYVRDMRFSPRVVDGKAVASRIHVQVRFGPTLPPTLANAAAKPH